MPDLVTTAKVRALAARAEQAARELTAIGAELRELVGDLPPALPLAGAPSAPEASGEASPGDLPLAGEIPEVSGDGEPQGEPGDRGKVAP